MSLNLEINGETRPVDVEDAKPLLWVLREDLGLQGAKFGCGIGMCGACTVLIDGVAIRSCILPVSQAEGKKVQTIEGLNDSLGTRLKDTWRELSVPQCGYCQTGQIMSAYALINEGKGTTDDSIDAGMTNICRCGTYGRIRAAIKRVSTESEAGQ